MTVELETLLPEIIALAQQAGEKILAIYHQAGAINVTKKIDNTPLTAADLAAHETLLHGLNNLAPHYPIISEESASIPFAQRQQWQRYWLIDPLDGTQEFIRRTDEFCINIALIEKHQPIFGLIYVPITQRCAYALRGKGAFEILTDGSHKQLHTRQRDKSKILLAMSRLHGQKKFLPFIENADSYEIIPSGSAIKFIMLASGEVDIYPRFGNTSEWDTAAGQCIVEEAGGKVVDLQGNVLQYNTKESLLNPEFIVVGDTHYDWLKNLK